MLKAMSEVTRLIQSISHGDSQAMTQLLGVVYAELRQLARSQMANERPNHTLQATALVHEAYLRLVGENVHWDSRGHFFAAAAEAMRRILVDHARQKRAMKRGGRVQRVELNGTMLPIETPCDELSDILSLDEVLDNFAIDYPEKAELVKLLYFAGLNLDEAAAAQGISRSTAFRHWQFARAWLLEAMSDKKELP